MKPNELIRDSFYTILSHNTTVNTQVEQIFADAKSYCPASGIEPATRQLTMVVLCS